jgi:putative urate catabolism protein
MMKGNESMAAEDPYARDLVGYGQTPPNPKWPNGARLALSFVLNYEEGAENSLLNGDGQSEIFITEVPSSTPLVGQRNVNTESLYDYGARSGIWRLLRLFDEFEMPLTAFAVGKALADNPEVGRELARRGHEVASHHWRWIDYSTVPETVERQHIQWSIEIIEELTGSKPAGWYGGRTSMNSRRLAAEADCFRYDSDVYDDDLPHWIQVEGKPWLLLPYTLDTNDFKFSISPGFSSGSDFARYLKGAFDELYREGLTYPKMLSVGLHCRMAGRPGRTAGLREFMEYVKTFPDVWVARRADIADHWRATHPASTR